MNLMDLGIAMSGFMRARQHLFRLRIVFLDIRGSLVGTMLRTFLLRNRKNTTGTASPEVLLRIQESLDGIVLWIGFVLAPGYIGLVEKLAAGNRL